jgi:tight adherence protein B
VVGAFPYAVGAGVIGVIGLLVYALGGNIGAPLKNFGKAFQVRLDRADMSVKPEDFALIVLAASAILWIAIVLVTHTTVIASLLMLPCSLAMSILGSSLYLKFRGDRRVNGFVQQLENVLRMLAGALRVGLGLRQAVILVSEEVRDPARREFMRVIGRTNIGIPIADALDELAKSMPTSEMQMFASVVRVQQSTGGDLAKVLERLAATIRDRRKVIRKMGALTAQGRFGSFIIGGLPVLVGGFVVSTQPEMGHALLHTTPGLIAVGIAVGLELAAIFTLSRILTFDV